MWPMILKAVRPCRKPWENTRGVSAGEVGGVLDVVLVRVADFMEKSERLKAKIKGAMVYPVTVLIASFLIVFGLMTFVIPRFADVLADLTDGQAKLPMLTQVLMDARSIEEFSVDNLWFEQGPDGEALGPYDDEQMLQRLKEGKTGCNSVPGKHYLIHIANIISNTCTYIDIHTFIYIYMYMYVCMYVCMYNPSNGPSM